MAIAKRESEAGEEVRGMGKGRRDVYLNPQEFNKQLPGMKRDASVYLYNEAVCRCVRAAGREREREREEKRKRIINERSG